MNLSKAWGYGAVVVPTKLFWQGFIVHDPATLAPFIGQAVAMVATWRPHRGAPATEDQIFGAMQSALVQTIMHGPEEKAAVFAAAVAELSGKRFYVVDAVPEVRGTTTDFTALEVETAEQARQAIDERVLLLKAVRILKEGG